MLKNTYVHIPRIGTTTERTIWKCGIESWEDFLENHDRIPLHRKKKRFLLSGIGESIEMLSSGNHRFFSQRLETRHHWRAYPYFKESSAYVDIETTGLSPEYNRITIIGIYNGTRSKTFIRGIDLEDAPAELAKYKQLITFNGARFDLPFIEHEFPGFFQHLHVDLLYPLKKIGHSGGLKNIERSLGLCRSEETEGLSGFDAVRLWEQYQRGSGEALETLIHYNTEDVVHLEQIIQMTYPEMVEQELKGKSKRIKGTASLRDNRLQRKP